MFRVYSIFYFEKIGWAVSEKNQNEKQKEKIVSNSSKAHTDQIRNIDPTRDCGGRSLLSGNETTAALTGESNDQNTDVQSICDCSIQYHNRQQYRYQRDSNTVISNIQSGAPQHESQHRHGQMSLKMSSKDISSPTLTHASSKKLSFSPRRILNRVTLTNESIKGFSSNPTTTTTSNSHTGHKFFFFSKNTAKENRLFFTKKLKRVFFFRQ